MSVETKLSPAHDQAARHPVDLLPCVQAHERRKRRRPQPRRYTWWQRIIRRIFGRR